MNDVIAPEQGSIGRGIGLVLALHAGAALVCAMIGLAASGDAMNGLVPFLGIGLFQLLYVVPALVIVLRKKQMRTAKGIQIALGITFLLNAACFGVVMVSLSGGNFH